MKKWLVNKLYMLRLHRSASASTQVMKQLRMILPRVKIFILMSSSTRSVILSLTFNLKSRKYSTYQARKATRSWSY